MSFVVIVGLVVAVIALLITNSQLNKQLNQVPKPKARRKKNGTNTK